ncbi:MAG: ABC transporter ATP-binding protein [Fusobacteriaceae bacterium]|nr:ABC transporter ATP-binding protein [Fusobacteriaceae bacterium]MBN2837655.1 ABC transporter ATP-binding protein [Fusobacteriaceae bacterium]
MNLLTLENIKKNYKLGETLVEALKGINLKVEKSDFLSIIGPSGSGKTTLLNIIGCIDNPSDGKVVLSNVEITNLNDKEITNLRLHKLGFIFQTFNLIPVLNIRENVEFPLLLMKKFSKNEIDKKVEKVIKEVGLENFINHRPSELSGGQRQRVAIARALVTEPEIILADEPTANLDSKTSEQILELMKKLNVSNKTTFIFSTHDPDVLKYANRIVKIKDGLLEE